MKKNFGFIFMATVCIMILLPTASVYAEGSDESVVVYDTENDDAENSEADNSEEDQSGEQDGDENKDVRPEENEREIENKVTDKSIDTEKIVDDVKEAGEKGIEAGKDAASKAGEAAGNAVDKGVYRFWEAYFGIHKKLKSFIPVVLIASIGIGAVIAVMSRKNKGLKRWSLIVLCGIVPFFYLMVVYAMPYVYLIFFKNATYSAESQIKGSGESRKAAALYYDLTVRRERGLKTGDKDVLGKCIYNFWSGYAGIYSVLKYIAPTAIAGSVILGAVIAVLAGENKRLSRWAFAALCVVIPMIILFAVKGIPFLQQVFR